MLTRICIVGNATLNRGGGQWGKERQKNKRPKHMKVINLPMTITETHFLLPSRVTFPRRFVDDCSFLLAPLDGKCSKTHKATNLGSRTFRGSFENFRQPFNLSHLDIGVPPKSV